MSLLYLEIINCESVKILIVELQGIVEIAERIANSSALYKEGQLRILAEKVCIILLS